MAVKSSPAPISFNTSTVRLVNLIYIDVVCRTLVPWASHLPQSNQRELRGANSAKRSFTSGDV